LEYRFYIGRVFSILSYLALLFMDWQTFMTVVFPTVSLGRGLRLNGFGSLSKDGAIGGNGLWRAVNCGRGRLVPLAVPMVFAVLCFLSTFKEEGRPLYSLMIHLINAWCDCRDFNAYLWKGLSVSGGVFLP